RSPERRGVLRAGRYSGWRPLTRARRDRAASLTTRAKLRSNAHDQHDCVSLAASRYGQCDTASTPSAAPASIPTRADIAPVAGKKKAPPAKAREAKSDAG